MEKTPSGWEKVKRTEGEGEGEGGESEEEGRDIVREELEDTLKAIDHQKRNMSSPPGISCEEDSDRFHTPSEMEAVRLKSKIHMSRSMDTISKVDVRTYTASYQTISLSVPTAFPMWFLFGIHNEYSPQ